MTAPGASSRHRLALLLGAMCPLAAIAAVPLAPNPAGAATANRCPTFQWHGDGAAAVEIEVYRLAGGDGASVEGLALRTSVAGPVTRWSASGAQCLQAGPHAWSVRSLPDGAWSDPLVFEVGGVPSDEELEAAIAVIEQYLAQRGKADTDPGSKPPLRAKGAGEVTAVQGLVPDGAGDTRGVHGSVASPTGVGMLAENTNPAGFDLRLAGPVAAQVNEREWRLDSAQPQIFNFRNPSGALALQVQGQPVVTTATDQNTTYAAGNQLSLAGTTFGVVEGPGSGLDADTLDGLSAADLAPGAHIHFGQTWGGSDVIGLRVDNASTANNIAIDGRATAVGGIGTVGVRGRTAGTMGSGIEGFADATTGTARGVVGVAFSPNGVGAFFSNVGGGAMIAADNASTSLATADFLVDNDGDVRARSFEGDGRPLTGVEPSLFRTFGGNGSNGALVVSGTTSAPLRAQYTTLTVNAGATLRVNPNSDGRTYIAVQGRCTIRGTINARGAGAPGPIVSFSSTSPGLAGRDAFNRQARAALPNCVSGAGGAGGTAVDMRGGNGGGAQGEGGDGNDGDPGETSDSWKRLGISGGGFGVRDGATGHDGFGMVLACAGASGGTGAVVDDDGVNSGVLQSRAGYGGGVVYLECGELELTSTGIIDARGDDGRSQTCSGSDCAIRDGIGGDGGGGGGVVLIRTRQLVNQSGQILVTGGAGGNGAGFLGGAGGAGAAGYADILVVD